LDESIVLFAGIRVNTVFFAIAFECPPKPPVSKIENLTFSYKEFKEEGMRLKLQVEQ